MTGRKCRFPGHPFYPRMSLEMINCGEPAGRTSAPGKKLPTKS
ncbi:hypothetical protein B4135_1745 [Caldibacillus debilis]|uniref:Uncharacterized protein n=1 Tax=Caldibacillus debilis TaxID=301148 RepID=A0A150M8T1_9BACI|nr:hypothetical protein B4135_1745 [Caldibacillus debilis]